MQLYLLRHAQSESNARWEANPGEPFHYPDPGLTELGRRQAIAAAEHFAQSSQDLPANAFNPDNRKGFAFTHIYSSLMRRAAETAHLIAERLDMPIHGRTDLHEWGGVYEWDVEKNENIGLPGQNRAFFTEHFPRLILPNDFTETGWWSRPHEPHANIPARVRRVLKFIYAQHGNTDDHVLVVTHGGFLNFFLSHFLGLTPKQAQKNLVNNQWFVTNNTALARIVIRQDFKGVIYLNRTAHLPEELIT